MNKYASLLSLPLSELLQAILTVLLPTTNSLFLLSLLLFELEYVIESKLPRKNVVLFSVHCEMCEEKFYQVSKNLHMHQTIVCQEL